MAFRCRDLRCSLIIKRRLTPGRHRGSRYEGNHRDIHLGVDLGLRAFALTPGSAAAQTTEAPTPSTELTEIIVTAQKREQSDSIGWHVNPGSDRRRANQ